MHRRVFMKSGAMALVTMGLTPSFLRRTAYGAELLQGAAARGGRGKTLVCLFQRGAADALNVVVPHGDRAYYAHRPNIAIARPTSGAAEAALDLDGFFGLHPAMAAFVPLWKDGLLAPVHAVGSPSSTRSHFDAQDYMESGTPDVKGTRDGWLNRYLATKGTCEDGCGGRSAVGGGSAPDAHRPSPFAAVSMTQQTPRILDGPAAVVAMNSLEEFTVRSGNAGTEARLEALYRTGSADVVHAAGGETFEALRILRAANPQKYRAAAHANYPRTPFGQRLRQIAQLIKSDVGLEIAFADVGGWDTHVNQGGATGQLAARLAEFSNAVAALVADLGDRMADVTILTMSEFGRTVRQNGTGGTDHGHAGALFVIGGDVKGGKVHGRWPGLAPEQLHEGRDLALTTDFRSVFGEVAAKHLGAAKVDALFPGYGKKEWLGVL